MTHRPMKRNGRRGMALAEAVMALLISSIMMVAALRATGGFAISRTQTAHRATATGLAQALMSEILQQAYRDPGSNPLFGPETNEINGSRSAFDDVDDYSDYYDPHPHERDGSDVPDGEGWERCVTVVYVSPTNSATVVSTDSGVKRITVTVKRNGADLVSLVALRANY